MTNCCAFVHFKIYDNNRHLPGNYETSSMDKKLVFFSVHFESASIESPDVQKRKECSEIVAICSERRVYQMQRNGKQTLGTLEIHRVVNNNKKKKQKKGRTVRERGFASERAPGIADVSQWASQRRRRLTLFLSLCTPLSPPESRRRTSMALGIGLRVPAAKRVRQSHSHANTASV